DLDHTIRKLVGIARGRRKVPRQQGASLANGIEHALNELSVAGGPADLLGKLLPGGLANLAVDSYVRDDLDTAGCRRHIDRTARARFRQVYAMRQELLVRLPPRAPRPGCIRPDGGP